MENSGIEIEDVQFWGSPWQPEFYDWVFNLPSGSLLAAMWALIPDDTDVLITHTPPYGILDQVTIGEHVGCEDLREAVKRVMSKVHVFGHIHKSYGMLKQNGITFINASVCDERYQPVNAPIAVDL
ncbi:MAG: hypothetical protein ACXV8J_01995 [Methylobacter sp.]